MPKVCRDATTQEIGLFATPSSIETPPKPNYDIMTPKIIAMAGKGGTGKTTLSALLIKYLIERGHTPVLGVDADANANLNELLDMEVMTTVGQIRKEIKGDIPDHISRSEYMEMKIHQSLLEAKGFDLLVMGQPDGSGCYCAANQYLAMVMDHLADNYRYILVDNEAGMEHLSRLNLKSIDHLLVISDPSARGVMTAGRVSEITQALGLEVDNKWMIVNRAPEPTPKALLDRIEETSQATNLPLAAILPSSNELIEQELSGGSYLELSDDIPYLQAAYKAFEKIIGNH